MLVDFKMFEIFEANNCPFYSLFFRQNFHFFKLNDVDKTKLKVV